jgi:hypothetical protein
MTRNGKKFGCYNRLYEEQDRIWYEIIRLEYLVSQGENHLRRTLNSHRTSYYYICRTLRQRFIL